MSEENRPFYVGHGKCDCGRLDVHLYRMPNAKFTDPLACSKCLEKAGFAVPRSRTADDIEVVDGEMRWRKS